MMRYPGTFSVTDQSNLFDLLRFNCRLKWVGKLIDRFFCISNLVQRHRKLKNQLGDYNAKYKYLIHAGLKRKENKLKINAEDPKRAKATKKDLGKI